MKTEIVTGNEPIKEIDWSIRQLVKSRTTSLTVLTNGAHIDNSFQGVVIIKDEEYSIGTFDSDWGKEHFYKVAEPLTIKFIP